MTAEEKQSSTIEKENRSEDQQIFISGRIWHELYPKVDPGLFLETLRSKIDLKKYGTGIAEFYFTFLALEKIPPNFSGWMGHSYDPRRAKLEMVARLLFDQLVTADKRTVIRLMEEALVSSIEEIGSIKLISPFDYKAFKADVEDIFSKEDWFE